MKKKARWYLFILLSLMLFCLFTAFIYVFIIPKSESSLSSGVVWSEGDDSDADEPSEVSYITVPGFTSFDFSGCSTTQEVSIYNPEKNPCYINIIIAIDDETIWESGDLYPGYGFTEIELSRTLDAGVYDATYQARCFDLDTNEELNGCIVNLKLYVN